MSSSSGRYMKHIMSYVLQDESTPLYTAGVSDEVFYISPSREEGEKERDSLANYLTSSLTM